MRSGLRRRSPAWSYSSSYGPSPTFARAIWIRPSCRPCSRSCSAAPSCWPWVFSSGRRSLRRGTLGGELRRLMLGGERIDQFAQGLAGDHLRQFVERQIDAVIGHPSLREIVGTDALGTVAGADLFATIGGAGGVDALSLRVINPRAQDVHG